MEADVTAAALERAIIFVREEEQKRILKLFHDKVVPHLVAAMFEAQFVKEELESRGLQEGEALSRMIERLVKAATVLFLDWQAGRSRIREADAANARSSLFPSATCGRYI